MKKNKLLAGINKINYFIFNIKKEGKRNFNGQ